ncbi:hypothetical protein H8959_015970 [Pygathrix nigripes]
MDVPKPPGVESAPRQPHLGPRPPEDGQPSGPFPSTHCARIHPAWRVELTQGKSTRDHRVLVMAARGTAAEFFPPFFAAIWHSRQPLSTGSPCIRHVGRVPAGLAEELLMEAAEEAPMGPTTLDPSLLPGGPLVSFVVWGDLQAPQQDGTLPEQGSHLQPDPVDMERPLICAKRSSAVPERPIDLEFLGPSGFESEMGKPEIPEARSLAQGCTVSWQQALEVKLLPVASSCVTCVVRGSQSPVISPKPSPGFLRGKGPRTWDPSPPPARNRQTRMEVPCELGGLQRAKEKTQAEGPAFQMGFELQ